MIVELGNWQPTLKNHFEYIQGFTYFVDKIYIIQKFEDLFISLHYLIIISSVTRRAVRENSLLSDAGITERSESVDLGLK